MSNSRIRGSRRWLICKDNLLKLLLKMRNLRSKETKAQRSIVRRQLNIRID